MPQKSAIITGAGGAIGRAAAIELSQLGYRTVLVGRTESTLQETAKLVADARVVVADVTVAADAERILTQSLAKFGGIDAIINNAGLAPVATIEQTTPQLWQQTIDTNLTAAYYLCRAAWPTFKKQGAGVVVNISSQSARDPFRGFLAYGAAKAALNTFGLSLAREGAAIGVRVHTIAPGAVETPMLRNFLSTEQYPAENTLLPRDVARVIAQCVAGDLQYTSGEVIWMSKHA